MCFLHSYAAQIVALFGISFLKLMLYVLDVTSRHLNYSTPNDNSFFKDINKVEHKVKLQFSPFSP